MSTHGRSDDTKRMQLSSGGIALIVIVIAAVTTGALFFSEDGLFENWFDEDPTTAQPAEIRARWLGMSFASTQSPTAKRLRIPQDTEGVLVAELLPRDAWRARAAGVSPGDIIFGVDGTRIRDIAEFADLSHHIDAQDSMMFDVNRAGQVLSLLLPSATGETNRAIDNMGTANTGALDRARGWFNGPPDVAPAGVPGLGAVPGLQPGMGGGLFGCPLHGLSWSQAAVHPHYRCPRCNTPLRQVR